MGQNLVRTAFVDKIRTNVVVKEVLGHLKHRFVGSGNTTRTVRLLTLLLLLMKRLQICPLALA